MCMSGWVGGWAGRGVGGMAGEETESSAVVPATLATLRGSRASPARPPALPPAQCVTSVVGANENARLRDTLPFIVASRMLLKMAVFPLAALGLKALLCQARGDGQGPVVGSAWEPVREPVRPRCGVPLRCNAAQGSPVPSASWRPRLTSRPSCCLQIGGVEKVAKHVPNAAMVFGVEGLAKVGAVKLLK